MERDLGYQKPQYLYNFLRVPGKDDTWKRVGHWFCLTGPNYLPPRMQQCWSSFLLLFARHGCQSSTTPEGTSKYPVGGHLALAKTLEDTLPRLLSMPRIMNPLLSSVSPPQDQALGGMGALSGLAVHTLWEAEPPSELWVGQEAAAVKSFLERQPGLHVRVTKTTLHNL
jgi:hypothetical protein